MTDSAPRLAPLGRGKRDLAHEKSVFRHGLFSARRVLLEMEGLSEVDTSLMLGHHNPFTSKNDRFIWLSAIEEARSLQSTRPRAEIERLIRATGGGM